MAEGKDRMPDKTRGAAIALSIAICVGATSAATQPAGSIEGVWKTARVEVDGAVRQDLTNPQPGLYMFTRGYFSEAADITSRTPRKTAAVADPTRLTEAEKLAKFEEWLPFAGVAGTYQLKGRALVRHPLVAKNVGRTTTDQTDDIELHGDTLVIRGKLPGQPDRERTLTLTRLR
jgi:hypothetical protein